MSRSGYNYDGDCESNYCYIWSFVVRRAIEGKRGQAFLISLRDALEVMPDKRLIADELISIG